MCDTFVATPDATADGRMLLAKNSDREPTEAQAVEVITGKSHGARELVRCTRLDIEQVAATRSILIGRPYWMWGAEMGVNDAGVSIGNEAVLTRAPQQPTGLLGMDLLRLALERSGTAMEALSVITELLETHGQGGIAGLRSAFRYHNSFLIADADDAWVLETADRAWVAQRVRGVRSISNGLSIRDDWDRASEHLAARARDYGITVGKGRVDFARAFSDRLMTWGAAAVRRRACTEAFLRRFDGRINPTIAMRALRQHGAPDRPERAARSPLMTVCGHASWPPTRSSSQTTGSLVSSSGHDGATSFVTATSAVCLSLFKPLWIDVPAPAIGTPGAKYDPSCCWWRHELVHRRALSDLAGALALIDAERDAFEARFVERAFDATDRDARAAVSAEAFRHAAVLEEQWLSRLGSQDPKLPGLFYRRFWRSVDRATALPEPGRGR